ncbi:MAG TPA: condensation domain-containing protein, partial [Thermoanaerobaculia bacterium]|nr:condensation domain-containing protein [Thermoanaerobaculia bacterium]
LNHTLRPWERPVIEGKVRPRIAGISSFGAGGSNAHLIVAEHESAVVPDAPALKDAHGRVAIVLSARTSEQLTRKASDLVAYLRAGEKHDLGAIAYTLQIGREPMEHRLGLMAATAGELLESLEGWLGGRSGHGVLVGRPRGEGDSLSLFDRDELQPVVAQWAASGRIGKLLELWLRGYDPDWAALYGETRPRRVPLPAYPFARERHWVDVPHRPRAEAARPAAAAAPPPAPLAAPQPQWHFGAAADRGRPQRLSGAEKMELFLRQELAQKLGRTLNDIAPDQSFFAAGLTSLDITDLVERTSHLLRENVSPAAAFEHTDVRRFAAHLAVAYATQIDAVEVSHSDAARAGTVAPVTPAMESAAPGRIPPIVPADRMSWDALPLSFAQERLWFINQLEPESAIYNISGAIRILGVVDVERLDDALNRVIARHDNLRTLFPSENGKARQRVLDRLDFRLARLDLRSAGDPEARREEARRLCQIEAATPFDLAAGPLLRGQILTLAPEEHVLMLNMHHIISDAWSMAVLTKELSLIMDGRGDALPPLPIQYADYSVWQRTWLEESGALERQLQYWQQKLAGLPEALEIETDYPRPAVQRYAGAVVPFRIDAACTERLKALARRQDCSLYVVLLAAFKALLHRYSGQEDLCIGTPIANRQYGGTAALIGMFANTIVLRSRVAASMPFTRLLADLAATTNEVHANQDAPFDKVVDRLGVRREANRNPL